LGNGKQLVANGALPAALNQTFELLKTLNPPPFRQNSDNRVWQEGRNAPHSNAYLVVTDQRQATGVWYAVDRELLFGVGRCPEGYPSYPLSYIGRVCGRCYGGCSSDFVPSKLTYNTTRRTGDFTATDSSRRCCFSGSQSRSRWDGGWADGFTARDRAERWCVCGPKNRTRLDRG
jgi:hypothetical protein